MSDTLPERRSLPMERAAGCPFDPPAEVTELRESEPVCPISMADGSDGWLFTRYEDIRTVLGDYARFSSRSELRTSATGHKAANRRPVAPGVLNAMDPPEHTRLRRKLGGKFNTRRMAQLTGRIVEIVEGRLDEMERLEPPVDLYQVFALPVPVMVICELLGVPFEDREKFHALGSELLSVGVTEERFQAARKSLSDFVGELAAKKRAHPTDDLLSELAADEDLTLQEVAAMGMVLLIAGHETTASMLALGTFALLENPEQVDLLRADPHRIDNAVEELLRYLTIVPYGVERAAAEDTEFGGRLIRKGDGIVAALMTGNRDPEKFADPDSLDITRSTTAHLAFGFGVHQCVGQQLARVELRVAFPALLNRFPSLRLAAPADTIGLRVQSITLGPTSVPVTWDTPAG
ncbi:cytochrome P450 [Streptomyces acidicola]|uniref:cytochrome P450 n=1 Tax=Streptomyces acidicola TaxID=2596892 RepID=UPI00342B81CC